MNRFVTNLCPKIAAQDQCDKHLRKMLIEEAQMLSTALHDNHPHMYRDDLYKPVHQGHPCTLWAGESCSNWLWAYKHWQGLAEEYEYRFGNADHRTIRVMRPLLHEVRNRVDFMTSWDNVHHTPHPQCFGDWPHKTKEDWPVTAYRSYIRDYKSTVMKEMKWTRRTQPQWFGRRTT